MAIIVKNVLLPMCCSGYGVSIKENKMACSEYDVTRLVKGRIALKMREMSEISLYFGFFFDKIWLKMAN